MTTANQPQLTEGFLRSASPEQIVAAYQAGQLDTMLTGETPATIPAEGQLHDGHLQAMTPEQIVEAQKAGRFSSLLEQPVPTREQVAAMDPAGSFSPFPYAPPPTAEQVARWTAEWNAAFPGQPGPQG